MPEPYPDNISTFMVTWRAVAGKQDSSDEGQEPELSPISGIKVTFVPTLSPPVYKLLSVPETVYQDPINAVTDVNGYLKVDDPDVPELGVKLVFGGDPDLTPTGWTWTAMIAAIGSFPARTITFFGEADGSVDLATLIPVPPNPGSELAAWELAVQQTQAAQSAAEAAAAEAQAVPTTTDGLMTSVFEDDTSAFRNAANSAYVPRRFDIRNYGAKCDGVFIRDAVTTAGQPTVSSASYAFTGGDIGKQIAVRSAGPMIANANDGVLLSTIISVSAGVATLSSNATASVTGADCIFGTPDDAAIAAAQDAAVLISPFLLGSGEVFFPPARTIVTQPLTVKSYVQWAGQSRNTTFVHVLRDGENWLNASGFTDASPLTGTSYHDFTIECWAFFRTAGYTNSLKPLNIFSHRNTDVSNMAINDSPATAIPFDRAQGYCSIVFNRVRNPGRLNPGESTSGGSGIGLGTVNSLTNPVLITGNSVIGTRAAGVRGSGNNGIFIESETGSSLSNTPIGYRIRDNYVYGMPCGIADEGAYGTVIGGNIVDSCGVGISLRANAPIGTSFQGRFAKIMGNHITGSRAVSGIGGDGITIERNASWPGNHGLIMGLIEGNTINRVDRYGIALLGLSTYYVNAVRIVNNILDNCGSTGILSQMKLRGCAIEGNTIGACGLNFNAGLDAYAIALLNIGEQSRVVGNIIADWSSTAPNEGVWISAGFTYSGTEILPVVAPYADAGTSAAATMSGKILPSGTASDEAWTIVDAGTSGAWSYTGTAMKPSGGTGRCLAVLDLSAKVTVTPQFGVGTITATVAALNGSSGNWIGVACGAMTTTDYYHFSARNVSGALRWLFARRNAGVDTTIATLPTATVPIVGDVVGIAFDGESVLAILNGKVVATYDAAAYTRPAKWGLIGAYATDSVSGVTNFAYTPQILAVF